MGSEVDVLSTAPDDDFLARVAVVGAYPPHGNGGTGLQLDDLSNWSSIPGREETASRGASSLGMIQMRVFFSVRLRRQQPTCHRPGLIS